MGVLKNINISVIKLSFALGGAMLLTGCYTDFTPDIEARPVLCINSLITAGEPITVQITRSWIYTDINGEKNHDVHDAEVTLYANDIQVGEDYIPREGDDIRIHAFSQTYGEAEAGVRVPIAPVLKDIEYSPLFKEGRVLDYGNTFCTTVDYDLGIHFTLVDSPDAVEYYHYDLEWYSEYEDESKDADSDDFSKDENDPLTSGEASSCVVRIGSLKYKAEPLFSEHISEFDEMMGGDAYGFTFFTDRQFSGKDYRLNIQYQNSQGVITCTPDNIEEVCNAGYVVCLSSVSESYYNWFNYCWQIYSGSIGDLSDIGLGEPVKGYSNVSTGAGVVAARSITKVRIPMDSFYSQMAKRALEKLRE